MNRFCLLTLLGLSILPCMGQDTLTFQQATDSIDQDLEKVLKQLSKVRRKIANEKPDLARRAAESAQMLHQKKRQFEVAKATQAATDHQLVKREEQLKLWREERNYLDGLLLDFSKTYRSSLPLSEEQLIGPQFDAVFSEKDPDAANLANLKLAEEMIARIPTIGGTREVQGSALDAEGTLVQGQFAVAGPLSWFLSETGTQAGLVTETRGLQPEIVPNTGDGQAIRSLLQGSKAKLRFDPTLGNAIAIDQIEGDWTSYFRKGGIWIYPILALAALALIAAIGKWIQLLGIKSVRPSTLQSIIEQVVKGDHTAAARQVEKIRHPARDLLEAGIHSVGQPVEDIEETIYQKYLEKQPALQRGLALIAIASATAPLLGLLGTVTGMIKTFNQITIFGTGDAKSLSGGISEALITTAFGLIVAIPALILHALLTRKIQGIRAAMETASLAFINGLKRIA